LTTKGIVDKYIDKIESKESKEIKAGVISRTNVYDIEE